MEVGSDFSAVQLVTHVPMRVVVSSVSAGIKFRGFVLRDGVVSESEFNLSQDTVP